MQVPVGRTVNMFQLLRGSVAVLFEVYQFMQKRGSTDGTAALRYTGIGTGAMQVAGFLGRRATRGSGGA